jgi:hypothetical protein
MANSPQKKAVQVENPDSLAPQLESDALNTYFNDKDFSEPDVSDEEIEIISKYGIPDLSHQDWVSLQNDMRSEMDREQDQKRIELRKEKIHEWADMFKMGLRKQNTTQQGFAKDLKNYLATTNLEVVKNTGTSVTLVNLFLQGHLPRSATRLLPFLGYAIEKNLISFYYSMKISSLCELIIWQTFGILIPMARNSLLHGWKAWASFCSKMTTTRLSLFFLEPILRPGIYIWILLNFFPPRPRLGFEILIIPIPVKYLRNVWVSNNSLNLREEAYNRANRVWCQVGISNSTLQSLLLY